MTHFAFEQIGGRIKLLEKPEMFSCSTENILADRAARKIRIEQEMAQEERQRRQARLALSTRLHEEWKETQDFLYLHDFAGVNHPKSSWWGFRQTYPLHTAAREHNWRMVELLLKFGADKNQKDSFGKLSLDFPIKTDMKKASWKARATRGGTASTRL